jgi:hypothetical protein
MLTEVQRKGTEQSCFYEIERMIDNYNGYNFDRIANIIRIRLDLTERSLKCKK